MKLKNKLLLGSLTAVLLAVMSFSAWKIWVIRSEYHAGEAAYEDISHMISLPQKAAVTPNSFKYGIFSFNPFISPIPSLLLS